MLSSGLIEPRDASARETAAKPAKGLREYSTIIELYDNILRLLFRSLESELGQQTLSIFNESKQVAASQPYEILRNFHPKNAVDINIREISQGLADIDDGADGRRTLIKSFNEFMANILTKAGHLLGPKMTLKTIEEINAVLPASEAGQNPINDRDHVIDEIKTVLSQIQERLGNRQT